MAGVGAHAIWLDQTCPLYLGQARTANLRGILAPRPTGPHLPQEDADLFVIYLLTYLHLALSYCSSGTEWQWLCGVNVCPSSWRRHQGLLISLGQLPQSLVVSNFHIGSY